MRSRREFLYTLVLGSGAVFTASLSSCTDHSDTGDRASVAQVQLPRPRTATPGHRIAHQYLRDGRATPTPTRTRRCDVVVIGGGMSGLAASQFVRNAGHHTIIVEAEPRAGGAAVSTRIDGAQVPLGSVYFVSRTPELDVLLSDAKVAPVVCPEDAIVLPDGQIVQHLWSDATLREMISDDRDRGGMQRFRDELIAMGDAVPSYPLAQALTQQEQYLDATSAAAYVGRYGSRTADALINAYSRSSMGAPSALTNAYCLLNFYQSELGSEFGFTRYSFPGGTSAFTTGLASLHGADLEHGIAVRVTEQAQDVYVDSIADDGSCTRVIAKHAIVAVPKYQLPRLMPQLAADRRDACGKLMYAPYVTIQVASTRPLQSSGAYDTWDLRPGRSYTDIINPMVLQTNAPQNIVSLYMACDVRERGMLLDDQAFAARVAIVVDEYAAGLTQEQRESITSVHAWGWGHGIVVPTVGSHNGIAQRVSAPMDRIVFAGTDNDSAPAIENAVANAFIAAVQVRQRLGSAGS